MPTSRWTKAGVIIAMLGLLVTGSIPWVTYYLIDPKFQELKHRPHLTATEAKVYYPTHRGSAIEISNGGLLPATGIKVTFRTIGPDVSLPEKPEIEIDPPSPYSIQRTDGDVTVLLERALGRGQKVWITMSGIAIPATVKKRVATAYVYSDEGEVEPIFGIGTVLPYDEPNFRPERPTRVRIEPSRQLARNDDQ